MWTDEQWAAFVAILQRGFAARAPFDEHDARVYRLLLDQVPPEAAMQAVHELIAEGQAFRPKPGDIVSRWRRAQNGKPTFAEAYQLIFGPRGVLRARPAQQRFIGAAEQRQLENDAAMQRAAEIHPLVAAFVQREGLDRLRRLPIDDPDYGELRRKELRESWERHLEAMEERDVAALVARSGKGELAKFNPLAILHGPDHPGSALPELPPGQETT